MGRNRNWNYNIFPDDLSFCILFGESSYLVNRAMMKMVTLPDLQVSNTNLFSTFSGKQFSISRDHSNLIYILESGEFIKYSLVEGTSLVVHITEPKDGDDDKHMLLGWKNSNELFYQRNAKQYSLNIETGESIFVGEYMFDIAQSPDEKYIAYIRPGWWIARDHMTYEENQKYDELFNEDAYGTIVQDAKTGEIVKFIPNEYLVGWFYD